MNETQFILHNQAIIMAALASLMPNKPVADALLKQAEAVERYFKELKL